MTDRDEVVRYAAHTKIRNGEHIYIDMQPQEHGAWVYYHDHQSLLLAAREELTELKLRHAALSAAFDLAHEAEEKLEAELAECRRLLALAVCPMKSSGCDGMQYPDYDSRGDVVGVQCQWCDEKNKVINALSGGERG